MSIFLLKKILLVDDDEDNRSAMSDILEFKGLSIVASAKNGLEAVEQFSKYTPDVVLMDIMMPEYDGFYGIEHIKNIDPNAKIIAVTADQSVETQRKLKEMQQNLIIFKPFDIDALVKMITD